MKRSSLLVCLSLFCLMACVQKSSIKTITLELNVAGIKDIQSVGVRGSEKPLSWYSDMTLTPVIKDTLYTTTFSMVTGYKFTEVKFTINGKEELENKDSRRIIFTDQDSMVYRAKYDVGQ